MREIEDFISPLVEQQFPSFYQEEGQLFITFVKAYYEWAEKNLQLITLEDSTNFVKGDTITQGDRTGTILATFNGYYLVQLNQDEIFKCNTFCNELTIATSSSGGSSFISTVRQFNHEFLSRNLPKYRDIDTTIDKFIIEFKNKYLPDVQFNTESNKRLFIKNALDFYRAKGTERAVDLFFKLIYGIEARTYYPGDDLFRLSDNEFIDVQYLELSASEENVQLIGQTIVGADSGATAYVERIVRVRKGSRFMELAYLANVVGDFITGEQITTIYLSSNVTAKIIGSFSTAEIISSDTDFAVGDILSITDGNGKKGKVRVTETENRTGQVTFNLLQSGWGYSANAEILGSNAVIRMDNLVVENEDWYYKSNPFQTFEIVQQDLISVTANTSTNTDIIPVAQTVIAYESNNIVFEGVVVSSNEDTGTVIVNYDASVYSNDSIVILADTLYNASNTLSMVIETSSTEIVNATAKVIACSNTSKITYTGLPILSRGDVLYQKNDNGGEYANAVVDVVTSNVETATYKVDITRNVGTFRTNRPFYRKSDDAEYSIVSVANTRIGVIDVQNVFYENGNTYGIDSGSYSPSRNFTYQTKADFDIQSFTNVVEFTNYYANDIIESANLNQIINSASYGLSGNTSLGFDDVISDALSYSNVEIGSIDAIVTVNPGQEYGLDPFFIIYEPKSYHTERYDLKIEYTDEEKNFNEGEIIVGSNTSAQGYITLHDRENRTIYATRISLANNLSVDEDFIVGENITGQDTNITSTISYINEVRGKERMGLNALVSSSAQSGNGFISQIVVLDSGVGYYDGEIVNAQLDSDPTKTLLMNISHGKQGISPGYFTTRKGFLSSDKYLHDNDFYQEYSYQVLTSLPFEVYKKTLIDVLHVAGTKPFGKYVGTTIERLDVQINTTTSDYRIGRMDLFQNENTFFDHTTKITFDVDSLFTNENVFFEATIT